MKKLLFLAGLLLAPNLYASSIIFLDEGINSQQASTVPPSYRGNQGCSSIRTQLDTTGALKVVYGSLCNDPTDTVVLGPNVAEYRNSKTYRHIPSGAQTSIRIREQRIIGGVTAEFGEHGNWSSNAARSFDVLTSEGEQLVHRPWVVFGLDRDNGVNNWVTFESDDPSGRSGDTIDTALDQIAFFTGDPSFPNSELRDLGAVNMSLGAADGGTLCAGSVGQAAVDEITSYGIAVVAGLPNTDIPENQLPWPACLRGVIKVAGDDAPQRTSVGVGATGIDFFAKYTTNDGQRGNSFAAPRVAAAFAELHKFFPLSTVQEKIDALEQASNKMDSYRTGAGTVHTARLIEPDQLFDAMEYLTALYPPANPVNNVLNIVDNGEYGTFFGEDRALYLTNLDFRGNGSSTASKSEVFKVGTGSLGLKRDVKLSFEGVVNTFIPIKGFKVRVNGIEAGEVTGFSGTSLVEKSFVINRNLLSDSISNQIELVPNDSSFTWGVTRLKMEFLPVIPLTLGVQDNNRYGYDETPTRYTGLRASFDLTEVPSSDSFLSAQGWDIDVDDETAVFVNGVLLGNLTSIGISSAYGPTDVLTLSPEILVVGTNYIEFVQREPVPGVWFGYQAEKWAIRNLMITREPPTPRTSWFPAIQLLLLED